MVGVYPLQKWRRRASPTQLSSIWRGSKSPRARIDRLVAEGSMPPEALIAAEALWEKRLRDGIRIPNGETAQVTLNDLYHLIVDDRIWRKPERIELLLRGVYEVRQAKLGRRRVLSRWQEGQREQRGFAIMDVNGRVWTMHLINERDLRRYSREEVLWP